MAAGLAAQEDFERMEVRRSLRRYGLEGRKRVFRPLLVSDVVGLAGQPDVLLESASAIAVVECKLTSSEPRDFEWVQLAAYAMLAEEVRGTPVDQVMVYRLVDDAVFARRFTDKWRERVAGLIEALHNAVRRGIDPGPTVDGRRCQPCAWANFCGDVW
jgi:CRISPR-associated protein Cas4